MQHHEIPHEPLQICFERMKRMQEDVDRLTKIIMGNGIEGHVTKISNFEIFMNSAKKDLEELKRFQYKLAGGAVVANIFCSFIVGWAIKHL